MVIPHLPGFQDSVHDAQTTFRALLTALARPGMPQTTASVAPPEGLVVGCAAAALTLLDLETVVWLQPGFPDAVHRWLQFHTGCRFTADPQAADFAVIGNMATCPPLEAFGWGTAEYPEASTALLIQCPSGQAGAAIALHGPGIVGEIRVTVPLGQSFWQQWHRMTASYPLGVDVWCCVADQVIGFPRTARIGCHESG